MTPEEKLAVTSGASDLMLGGDSPAMMRALAETQAAFLMAIKNPRDETKARKELLEDVERVDFAAEAFYLYERGSTEIHGPSVNFARQFAMRWRNILYGARIVSETYGAGTLENPGTLLIEAYAWDIERNLRVTSQDSFKRLIQRSKWKNGVKTTHWVVPDERDLRELVERRSAIQYRNCILRLAPRDLVNDLTNKAIHTAEGGTGAEDLPKARVLALRQFERRGVTQEMLERKLGISVDKATPKHLATMRGWYAAIKDGAETVEGLFPEEDAAGTPPTTPPPAAPSSLGDFATPFDDEGIKGLIGNLVKLGVAEEKIEAAIETAGASKIVLVQGLGALLVEASRPPKEAVGPAEIEPGQKPAGNTLY